MIDLVNRFNTAFPNFAPTYFGNFCIVKEPNNATNGKLHQLRFDGVSGYVFPHELPAKMSSFASASGNNGVLNFDCDGVMLFEHDDQKYILFSELKSTFSTEEIVHAKDQLVGSYVKFIGVLSVLRGFNKNDYKVVGVIASFEPTDEQLNAVGKNDDRKSMFALKLFRDRHKMMLAKECDAFFYPLSVGDFPIYYVPVADRKTSVSIDVGIMLAL